MKGTKRYMYFYTYTYKQNHAHTHTYIYLYYTSTCRPSTSTPHEDVHAAKSPSSDMASMALPRGQSPHQCVDAGDKSPNPPEEGVG